jgi:hypothetical protein
MLNTSNLTVALEAVARIDRELALAVDQADALAVHTHNRVLTDLRGSLARSVEGTRELREELLAVPGDASEQYRAVAVRERTAALILRLTELTLVEHEAAEVAHRLYVGKFHRLHDVNTYVLDRVGTVSESCFVARLAAETWRDDEGAEPSGRRDDYRNVLASAHDSLTRIGDDEDLRHFLRVGSALESRPFRAACRGLAMLLDIRPAQF